MLKTYRIIPLVFILFLFGFTLISVAPVLAQATVSNPQVNHHFNIVNTRINLLEKLVCVLAERAGVEGALTYRDEKGQSITLCEENMSVDPITALEQNRPKIDTSNWDKDPFAYSPDGSSRPSPDGKFRCVGFPEIRENPNEPKGVAYAKCKQKFGEATGNTAPPPKKFFCAQFPEALNYQECMQKKKKVEECQRNRSMC